MVHLVSSSAEFSDLIKNNEMVVVDYFAEWCGPCKMIAPKFEQFSQAYSKAKFIKVDVDQLEDVAQSAGIRAMPTFHIYVKGQKAAEIIGADPKKLEDAIKQHYVA